MYSNGRQAHIMRPASAFAPTSDQKAPSYAKSCSPRHICTPNASHAWSLWSQVAPKSILCLGMAVCSRKRIRKGCFRGSTAAPSVDGFMIKPDECPELIRQSRLAHWVIRTSELKVTLSFLSDVFEMRVLRHEEFDKPCAITCNGAYDTPWSKTMVGYGPENVGYCLELTYNYGISSYVTGKNLAHIAVGVDCPGEVIKAARSKGYAVDGDVIEGPDGYRFRAIQQPTGRTERFAYVALKVSDVSKAARFYENVLGMKDLSAQQSVVIPDVPTHHSRIVGYCTEQVSLALCQDEFMQCIGMEAWDGRNAVAIPARAQRAVFQRVLEGMGGDVLHPIREFNELPQLRRLRGLPPMSCKPSPEEQLRALRENPASAPTTGTLAVAILRDDDGYEICLVSSETYDYAVLNAYNPDIVIDWLWRKDAQSGKRTPAPQHMLACV